MKVTIAYKYKDNIVEYENVTNIKGTFDYKLGAGIVLKIEGKRNRVRIPDFDIRWMTVTD